MFISGNTIHLNSIGNWSKHLSKMKNNIRMFKQVFIYLNRHNNRIKGKKEIWLILSVEKGQNNERFVCRPVVNHTVQSMSYFSFI